MKKLEIEKPLLDVTKDNTSQKSLVLTSPSYNMGIPEFNALYIEVNENQSRYDEYNKIVLFLKEFMKEYAKKYNKNISDLKLTFINYGKTELVYVLTDESNKKLTLLVKQPCVNFGDVYEEMQNLISLRKRDNNVVSPIDYFSLNDQELYITPYINQARCVASYTSWGMYVPEPWYRFENFNSLQEDIVTTSMIAKLISLYDFKKQEGIIKCKLGGGDFMLPKNWENEPLSIENTINSLYLIAARKIINCEYSKYIEILKNEFSRQTIYENPRDLILNLRGRVPMKIECINEGIQIGEKMNNSIKIKTLKRF